MFEIRISAMEIVVSVDFMCNIVRSCLFLSIYTRISKTSILLTFLGQI